MSIYNNRVCRECGITFSGGPRAWYCPECREKRKRLRANKPTNRPLGSYDICVNCGKQYIVSSGLQKYCPFCKNEMYRKIDNEQGKTYYREIIDKCKRNASRRERHAKHREEDNAARRITYAQNAEKIGETAKKWRDRNPEKMKKYNHDNYVRHSGRIKEYQAKYRAEHKKKEEKK